MNSGSDTPSGAAGFNSDKELTPLSPMAIYEPALQNQEIYIASSYCFVLIILGFVLTKTLYEIKSLRNEKKETN